MQRSEALLWTVAVATYGVGDTLTTYINLASGARELNPLLNCYTIIPIKIFIFLILYIISRSIKKELAPLMLIAVGLAGIFWNLFSFLSIYAFKM